MQSGKCGGGFLTLKNKKCFHLCGVSWVLKKKRCTVYSKLKVVNPQWNTLWVNTAFTNSDFQH